MQRLSITFSKGEELLFISHLDLMRLWQRSLRRAGIPVVYSQGFSPHPRISLASPLPVGVTSSGELMDLQLERRLSPNFFLKTIYTQLPRGIAISEIIEIPLQSPSLQSQTRFAEYSVVIKSDERHDEIEKALESLLNETTIPWQHLRNKEIRQYDLRGLIQDLWIAEWNDHRGTLGMRLKCDSTGTGRPEQVTLALGFDKPPTSIHRQRIILAKGSNAFSSQRSG